MTDIDAINHAYGADGPGRIYGDEGSVLVADATRAAKATAPTASLATAWKSFCDANREMGQRAVEDKPITVAELDADKLAVKALEASLVAAGV